MYRASKILIINAYSWHNSGDAAIVLGMLRDLRASFPNAEIAISSMNPDVDRHHYDCPVLTSFRAMMLTWGSYRLGLLFFYLVLLPMSALWAMVFRADRCPFIPAAMRNLLEAYMDADLVIACGGGYFYGRPGLRGALTFGTAVYPLLLAQLLDRPLYLYSQSIGPFTNWFQKSIARRILQRAQLVQAREGISLRVAREIAPGAPVVEAVDAAFLYAVSFAQGAATPSVAEREAKRVVGITVRTWLDPIAQSSLEAELARYIDWLCEAGYRPTIIPQVTTARDDDRIAAQRIKRAIAADSPAVFIDRRMEPDEIVRFCSGCLFFVGMRMHSNILALSCGTPSLAISYQPKSEGIMASLGLSDYVITDAQVTADLLRQRTEQLLSNRFAIEGQLQQMMAKLAERVYENGQAIRKHFDIAYGHAQH